MSKPYIHYPDSQPQQGENHRTVSIRHKGSTISIRCKDRATANDLGKALIGVFNRYLPSNQKTNIKS